jgi:hypothetical protein
MDTADVLCSWFISTFDKCASFWASLYSLHAFDARHDVSAAHPGGAEQNYTDKDGRSPLSVAQLYRRAGVMDILTQSQ